MNNLVMRKNSQFSDLYNRSYRLVAAVFSVCAVMDDGEGLKVKIKDLALELVGIAVNLKDTNFSEAKKLISELDKKTILLMSFLDIASITGLISDMNGNILKEEFSIFLDELRKFSGQVELEKNTSIRGILESNTVADFAHTESHEARHSVHSGVTGSISVSKFPNNGGKNGNGVKRKDTRRNTILQFIKGHNDASIKDIVPHIIGCSEKTVQRELISLIREGKIRKEGERRWSKYSIV